MAGTAIGLGNIWRFPYMMGEHGGSAFVIVYIISTVIVSLPVFLSEVIIGRRSRVNACGAMSVLDPSRKVWKLAGILPILIPVIIASYYSVIGGWSVDFFIKACTDTFSKVAPSEVGNLFGDFVATKRGPVVMHLLFLLLSAAVVAGGVKSGIEKFSKITMPVLFVLVVIIMGYSVCLPGAGEGVRYMLRPDFSEFSPRTLAYAMGQSFYSLSLGMGAIITYGSYVRKDENILATSTGTALFDLGFAILAGLAIMPAVFAAGISSGAGPGLIFQSIPYIFSTMSGEMPVFSAVIAILFFLTVIVAAMTSCISLIEVVAAFLVERYRIRRLAACSIIFVVCGSLGVICAVDGSVFDSFDWISSNILLLLMAFVAVFFVGHVMKREDVKDEFTNGSSLKINVRMFPVFYFLMKWIAPTAVVLIFITNFIL